MRARFFSSWSMAILLASIAFPTEILAQGTTYTSIERGRTLVNAGDCAACHTAPGGKPYAGGLPIETPFGVIYSTNITPDAATGIGKWSEQDFYNAMHSGIRRDGQHLYPAFPYPWFTKVSRDDVRAIRAFLNTVEPVRQENKPTELPWPLSMREVMAGWNQLYFKEGTYKPDPAKSQQWNRGAYLVEGLGHCGACHTATNVFGAPKKEQRFQGGDFGEHWYAPSLSGDLGAGLGAWSEADIVEYLKTGANGRTAAAGPMVDVIKNSTQHLSQADLSAIATYLKDIPAAKNTATANTGQPDRQVLARGEALYFDQCIGCHMENGAGLENVFPSLKGSSSVQAKRPDSLIHFVLTGAQEAATQRKPTAFAMPAFDWKLDDQQVADLVTYIRNAWGNHASAADADTVTKIRQGVRQGRE